MRAIASIFGRTALCLAVGGALSAAWSIGCVGGGGGGILDLFGSPFRDVVGTPGGQPGGGGGQPGGGFGGDDRGSVDPCDESLNRKFITISMRSLVEFDHVHYFLLMVAFVNTEGVEGGAVCEDDINLYTQNGYVLIPEGQSQAFGNFCIPGPALVRFHEEGRFRRSTGAAGLASAIAPAQGSAASFDNFFTSAGARLPVPDLIIFHNPGSGEGAALKVSVNSTDPCNPLILLGDPDCQQDAFYYVDETDRFSGSNALGNGSGRRVPGEIQGTGCECTGFTDAAQLLAPSRTSASSARCNEFLRGGRIEYVFIRDDRDPPIPQLLWRVTDQGGGVVHNFDQRAGIP